EAAGVFLEGEEPAPYLRPATPPRFFPEVTVSSINRLLDLKGTYICYAHFGWSGDAEKMLTLALEQLNLWRGVVCELLDGGVPPSDEEVFFQELMKRDALLGALRTMEPDIQEREREFIGNSISGFLGAYGRGGE
ncbi:MAG TPA: MBL fold metallo-hydrolase, partial [Synergistaceae bacterium]|nr:MBL fold metallo-hydrolase [Synergistaceae bacterium]